MAFWEPLCRATKVQKWVSDAHPVNIDQLDHYVRIVTTFKLFGENQRT